MNKTLELPEHAGTLLGQAVSCGLLVGPSSRLRGRDERAYPERLKQTGGNMAVKKWASAKKRNLKGYSAKQVLDKGEPMDGWNVVWGKLKSRRGRPKKVKPLFKVVAEKIPFGFIGQVQRQLKEEEVPSKGVYMAHDSMGVARYGGRGNIFNRLSAHKKAYPRELIYFSFYIIEDKTHEREIETAILRAAGGQMVLNTRKVRAGIEVGDVGDYEPGTLFFERQSQRGRKAKTARKGRPAPG